MMQIDSLHAQTISIGEVGDEEPFMISAVRQVFGALAIIHRHIDHLTQGWLKIFDLQYETRVVKSLQAQDVVRLTVWT